MRLRLSERPWLTVLAVAGVLLFFVANRGAYEGFFSDDDFDNLGWTTIVGWDVFREGFVTPKFSFDNFRPAGHMFYRLMHLVVQFDFPRWVLALQCIHLLNVFLVFRLCRALGVAERGAVAGAAIFAFHPALFAAFWKPMYDFDLTCATCLVASALFYLRDRLVLSVLAFWLAYKAKEMAIFFPIALALVEALRTRRWWRLAPFCAISLSFGLQAVLANRVRDTSYTLRFTAEAMGGSLRFYLGHVALVLAPAALWAWRDRRLWLALAAFIALMGPLWFLPGRLFAVYLYVPMIAVVIGIGFAGEKVPVKWLGALAACWLAWVYLVDLRAYRRAELTVGRENRVFFERACAMKGELQREIATKAAVLYEGGPPHLAPWGVTGVYHLCYSPELKLIPLDLYDPHWKEQGAAALSWNTATQQLQVMRREPSNSMNVFGFDRGWHAMNAGARWSTENPMAHVLQPPGTGELQVVAYPTADQLKLVGKIQLVVYVDGQWVGDAELDRAVPFIRSWPVPLVKDATVRVVDFQVTPFHTVPGSPRRYGLPFGDYSFRKRQP